MYIDALKDIIKDLVSICGEEMDDSTAIAELDLLDKKIEYLESIENISSFEKMDLDIAKVRKEYWENSASYIGNKIINGFDNKDDKEELISLFNILFEQANKRFDALNKALEENKNNNIWDLLNKKKVELIKLNSKDVKPDKHISYSNVVEHYQNKKSLIENVISSLAEKKVIVDETINLYNDIIRKIADEIRENNDALLTYNDKKLQMAYELTPEVKFIEINGEINKLREIKTFNEQQLKLFNNELEKYLKEKEQLEKEVSVRQEELTEIDEQLKEFEKRALEGEYISKENVITNTFNITNLEKEIKRLEIQKNLIYVSLNRIKDMGIDILQKGNVEMGIDLTKDFNVEEVKQIEEMVELLGITKEEAIKAFEAKKESELEKEKINNYMDEFDLSVDEAKEAIEKEKPENRFWNVEEV